MPVYAEPILIHTIYIMVLAHINAVTIVVGVEAPNKVMPPQIFIVGIVICKERIYTKNCGGETNVTLQQFLWTFGAAFLQNFFLNQIPP